MDLPEHMRGLFKSFEVHGANLRMKFPGLKRSIKFNDATQSLCMDVKMPDKTTWHRINEVEMREIARRQSNRPLPTLFARQSEDDEADRMRILAADDEIPVVGSDEEQDGSSS